MRTQQDLDSSQGKLRGLIEKSQDGIVLTDEQGIVIEWNPGMEAITGLPAAEVLGEPMWDVQFRLGPRELQTPENLAAIKANTSEVLRTGNAPWVGKLVTSEYQHPAGDRRQLQNIIFPIQTECGFMLGSVARDVTEQKRAEELLRASLREKETMLAEIHHRVKNNLQIISSLLDFQQNFATDEPSRLALQESRNRVHSMALIHEQLYRSESLAEIEFSSYISNLLTDLEMAYQVNPDRIHLEVDVPEVILGISQAIPCSLIINELVSNAFKYAFPEDAGWPADFRGVVQVKMAHTPEGEYTLSVSDNGIGLPANFDESQNTLGMFLIGTFTQQLRGQAIWSTKAGTTCQIIFRG